jgi:hypothetical protein
MSLETPNFISGATRLGRETLQLIDQSTKSTGLVCILRPANRQKKVLGGL